MAIDVRQLHYRFPEATADALRGIDWAVNRGATVLVTGPSGGGKTTLLRCLNGLIPHFHGGWYGGAVSVLGHEVARSSPRDLAPVAGSVFQDPEAQLVTDSVIDEIVFTMEQLGYARRVMERRLDEIIELLGIERLTERRISTLSGGERQIVALASALAHQPPVLILDEPTSQLDDAAASRFIAALGQLQQRFGQTTLIAEHRTERFRRLANQIVTIERGTLTPISVDQLPVSLATPERSSASFGEPLLAMDQLQFSYGDEGILRGLNMEASAGEVIALRGMNGSGKTTLFKLIAGLLRPAGGTISWRGRSIDARSPAERAAFIGYVPQHPGSILHQETLDEELAFTCRVQQRAPAIPDILDQLEIGQHANHHPLDLSGGERQRAAIAAIAVTAPEILLLDEPTRGLSRDEQRILVQFIRDYAAAGRLVILASHDEQVGRAAADRVVSLTNGTLSESLVEMPALARSIS